MMKNKVEIEGTTQLALKIASNDPVFRAATVGVLANRTNVPSEAFGLLGLVAASDKEPAVLRGRALRGLIRSLDKPAARDAAVVALAAVGRLEKPPGELSSAWQDFVKDGRQARDLGYYARLAEGPDPASAESGLCRDPECRRQPEDAGPDQAGRPRPRSPAPWLNPR